MAITVTDSNNRLHDADNKTGWTSEGGGGGNPVEETDFVYQGTESVSRKIGTSKGGFKYAQVTEIDMSVAGDRLLMIKAMWANAASLEPEPSAELWIGNQDDVFKYQILDDGSRGDITPKPTRLWLINMINPNVAAWVDLYLNSPVATNVQRVVIQGDFTGSAKSENVAMDAIDISPGLWLVGSSPDGTWLDFVDYDEGTIGNRIGHVITLGTTIVLYGKFVIGRNASASVTLTEFVDSNRIIEFPGGRVDEGENGLEIDLGNASTVVTMTSIVFTGAGRDGKTFIVATDLANIGADDWDIGPGQDYLTGDVLLYSIRGGTAVGGLVDATEYFVRQEFGNRVEFFAIGGGRSNAYLDTSVIDLTSVPSPAEAHSFTKLPATHPDLLVTGNSGSCVFDLCTFNNFNIVTLTSGATIKNSIFNGLRSLDMADSATVEGCVFNAPRTYEESAQINTPSPDDISDCIFNGPKIVANINLHGYAVEVEATGTFGYSGNTHNDYGPNPMEFNPSTDIDDGNDEIDFVGHPWITESAVFYNDRGGTTITGLTDQTLYFVRSLTADSFSLHPTARSAFQNLNKIAIAVGSDEIHAIESADAAILNSSGGLVTLNVTDGDTPTVRNTAGSSTVVNNAVNVTITGVTEGAAIKIVATATVGSVTAGDTLLEALADSDGEATFAHSYEGDLTVEIRARQQGLPNAAIQDDNGVFTDETAEANSAATNDMNLLPAVEVATEDRYLFGHAEKFGQLKLDIGTASDGGTIVWQYWNGAWVNLSGVTDGTNGFQNTGENIVSWTIPGDWATQTVNSQGPFFYVRAALTAGSTTVQPKGRKTKLDVPRYIPASQDNVIESTGLTTTLSWQEDTISVF